MAGSRGRWLVTGIATGTSAGLLAWSTLAAAGAHGAPAAPPLPEPVPQITQVMGPSGVPIPSPEYIEAINRLYLQPNMPGTTPAGLFTPEGLYPITGVKSLPLEPSVLQGVAILDDTVRSDIDAGTPVGVFGWSQSAIVASRWMEQLDPAGTPSDIGLRFVLAGNEMNPNGGLLSRFEDLTLPSLGIPFYGATPDNDFPTTMYTAEYDGFADFPRYPLNILSGLNAFLGIALVHIHYSDFTEEQVTPVEDGGQAIRLATEGPTLTTYYMIPTAELPLVAPLRLLPVIGDPLADLLQPILRPIVNLGYGDPDYGWSTAPANVHTSIGILPGLDEFAKLPGLLASGTQQGIQAFADDLAHLSLPDPAALTGNLAAVDPSTALSAPTDFATNAVNAITAATASAYSTLLPTADIVNALVTSLPLYNVDLFWANLDNPIDAIGLPISADAGLLTMALGVEALVIAGAAKDIADELQNLFG